MGKFTTPSVKIDAAICNLLAKIYTFSDLNFDTEAVGLEEDEIELIVVRLIEEVSSSLTGKVLEVHLQTIRQTEQGEETCFIFPEDIYLR